ncbi:MAG: esterase-like activity of phytase family protein, partial [Burkholderiales bacterium]
IIFTDPKGLLSAPTNPAADPTALNGLNPLVLNGDASTLGRSFDPEGFVINPRTGNLLVSDEYGPSIYEFNRRGELIRVFETPANLTSKVNGSTNYVADRDAGLNAGRQDNRGFEGLAITPDGKMLYAVLQDPLVNEPSPNNGRNGRNLRIVAFDNDRISPTYATSIAQYAYQLELQADIMQRIHSRWWICHQYRSTRRPKHRAFCYRGAQHPRVLGA